MAQKLNFKAKKTRDAVKSVCLASGIAVSFAAAANAQSVTQPNAPPATQPSAQSAEQSTQSALVRLFQQPTLTGDWGGARTALANDGIAVTAEYINQMASVPAGGFRQGTDFANQASFNVTFDLNKLLGDQGGTFDVGFDQRWGRSASQDFIGNKIPVQFVIGTGENFRINNLKWTQLWDQGRVTTMLGDFSMGDTYGKDQFFCDFESNVFCAHPGAEPVGSGGWSDNPDARWGANIQVDPTPNTYIETGVFESNPDITTYEGGLQLSLRGANGALFALQTGVTPTLFGLPGRYSIGGYYDTATVDDILDPEQQDTGQYGGYVVFHQEVLSLSPDHHRGLFVFGTFIHTNNTTTDLPQQLTAGFELKGPFASRPNDYFNFGISHMWLNHRLINKQEAILAKDNIIDYGVQEGETDIEFGYGFQAAPWLLVHPNVQYVADPGAFTYTQIPNAWVLGLDTRVLF